MLSWALERKGWRGLNSEHPVDEALELEVILPGLLGDPTLSPRSPGALWWSVLFQLHPGVRLKRG